MVDEVSSCENEWNVWWAARDLELNENVILFVILITDIINYYYNKTKAHLPCKATSKTLSVLWSKFDCRIPLKSTYLFGQKWLYIAPVSKTSFGFKFFNHFKINRQHFFITFARNSLYNINWHYDETYTVCWFESVTHSSLQRVAESMLVVQIFFTRTTDTSL